MIRKYLCMLLLLIVPMLAIPASAGAIDVFDKGVCDRNVNNSKNATVCKDKNIRTDKNDPASAQQNPLFGKDGVLTTAIKILTAIVAIIAIITIILAGLKFITSGSNPQDVTKAREQIIYAAIALAVAALAQFAVRFILERV